MVLVDTSVWIDHFRKGNSQLEELLSNVEVACHPFVIGELACGNLKNRTQILTYLDALPRTKVADPREIMLFIEKNRLMGIGLGFVDIHLLASAILSEIPLWTMDIQLKKVSTRLKVNFV